MNQTATQSPFQIAIDGPVAAGKGTISRIVAQRLGLLYIDTGAMYRMAAYLALENKIELTNEPAIVELINNSKMDMRNPNTDEQDGRLITLFLDGEDVSWKVRTEEISQGASKVSTLAEVRKVLVKKQQQIAEGNSVIMEGRDITHRVLPQADLKIFLTASTEARAERRLLQSQLKGFDVTLEKVIADIKERDDRDMGRKADPLQIVDDAWVLDTSELSIEDAVEAIVEKAQSLRK